MTSETVTGLDWLLGFELLLEGGWPTRGGGRASAPSSPIIGNNNEHTSKELKTSTCLPASRRTLRSVIEVKGSLTGTISRAFVKSSWS